MDALPNSHHDKAHPAAGGGPRPLRIGSLELSLPVVQAALSGYSDWPMRAVARHFGAPYTICEVMLDQFVSTLRRPGPTKRFLHLTDDDFPTGAQLMGADPEAFSVAAKRVVEAGFHVVDINFGCPVKKVLGRCRGGFHLGQPPVAREIMTRVRDAVQVPVTVKMRRGVDDSQESADQFLEIFEAAGSIGLDAVTVHGRTVMQRYNGPSKWEFLANLKREFPNRTILGSGDLHTAQDCVRMLRETGVDGVTAARGAIGNPWIFRQAATLLNGSTELQPPTVHEQRDALEMHRACAGQIYSKEMISRRLRKFGIQYSAWHPEEKAVRNAFIDVKNGDDWDGVLSNLYAIDAPGKYPKPPESNETSVVSID